jgi:hypothetical protein
VEKRGQVNPSIFEKRPDCHSGDTAISWHKMTAISSRRA